MRFECHVVLDLESAKYWLRDIWIRVFGNRKPEWDNGDIFWYEWRGCGYGIRRFFT